MILATVVVAGAYPLTGSAPRRPCPPNIVPFLVIVLGLLVAAHLAVRAWRRWPMGSLPLAALLTRGATCYRRLDEDLAGLQALWTAIGTARSPSRSLSARIGTWSGSGTRSCSPASRCLVLPLLPVIGREINGAHALGQLRPRELPTGRVRPRSPWPSSSRPTWRTRTAGRDPSVAPSSTAPSTGPDPAGVGLLADGGCSSRRTSVSASSSLCSW